MSASKGASNDHPDIPKETWICPLCTAVNDSDHLNCTSCFGGTNPNQSEHESLSCLMLHEQQKKIDESDLVQRSLTQRVKSLLYSKEDDWHCPVCTLKMSGWYNTCTVCGTTLKPYQSSQARSRSKSTGSSGIFGSISSLWLGRKSSEPEDESPVVAISLDSLQGGYVDISVDSNGIPCDKIVPGDSSNETCSSFSPQSSRLDQSYSLLHLTTDDTAQNSESNQSWRCSMCGAYNRIDRPTVPQKCYVCNIGEPPSTVFSRRKACNTAPSRLSHFKQPVSENRVRIRSQEEQGDITPSPSGQPLLKDSTYPGVTFFDEAEEIVFSSDGGHVDFDNGMEINVPSGAVSPGATIKIKVQPSFAPNNVFVMPEGIQSASPSYLITGSDSELDRELTLSLDHHVKVSSSDDAADLLFLEADVRPKMADSANVYEYKEITGARAEFTPGEKIGKLTTRQLSDKFVKVGRQRRNVTNSSCASKDDPLQLSTSETQPPDPNVYTVRAYNSSPQGSGDRMTILAVSLYGRGYQKFLKEFDTVVIPHDYPEVSSRPGDRTTISALSLKELQAKLSVDSAPEGWRVDTDRKSISKSEVDLPEIGNFRPEDLHDYPPRIHCRHHPEDHTPPVTTCTLSFSGFDEEVKISVLLEAPKIRRLVDTRMLQEAAENLRITTTQVKETTLLPTARSILVQMETVSSALRSSSSLRVLADNVDLIKVEVQSVIDLARKVAEECSIPYIKANIESSLSKMKALSHQLCQVTKVGSKHCQDSSEEASAVINGANLLNAVNSLLNSINTLNYIKGPSSAHLTVTADEIAKAVDVDPRQLDQECSKSDLLSLSRLIPNWYDFSVALGLTKPERNGVLTNVHLIDNGAKAYEMLDLWFRKESCTSESHYRRLVEAALNQCTPDQELAADICKLTKKNIL